LSVLNINSHSPQSGEWLAEALNAPTLRKPASHPVNAAIERPNPLELVSRVIANTQGR
jgi:hypothetical protein